MQAVRERVPWGAVSERSKACKAVCERKEHGQQSFRGGAIKCSLLGRGSLAAFCE